MTSDLSGIAQAKVLLAIAVCLCAGTAAANPLGPQVANGQARFTQQGNTLAITNTPNAIINWQSFSIDPGEVTRFIQQNPSSSVLNRIVGQNPSQILGALQSNGRVLLINPNGVIFGAGARVDVNGLVASTLHLSDQDFLAGRLNFTAGDKAAGIQNQGAISTPSGGQVYLIAPNVENSGLITSPQGQVVLAAGHTVKLVEAANPDLHVVVSAPADCAINVGQIVAQGGRIGIYSTLIQQRGVVNANSLVVGENGKILFKASRDTLLDAGSRTTSTGAGKGGEIHILGDRVALTGNATVDASGRSGGGTILVGGDYQGKNPGIQNAAQTYLAPGARIAADALDSGDGGKVIVWSNEATRAYCSISARGGATSGNGGFVEVSSHYLDMQASVDTRAPNGATGTLLLDPTNIYIASNLASANAAGMTGGDSSASTGPFFFAGAGSVSDSLLSVATLQGALASSSVIVSTANASGGGAGVIRVVDTVSWGTSNSLSLIADSDILLDAMFTGPAAAVTLSAPTGGIFGAGRITAASLTATASGGIGQGSPLQTQVAALNVTNTGSDTHINISNTGALDILGATQTFQNGVGMITIATTGPMTVSGSVTTSRGNILLSAVGPLTNAGSVSSESGTVTLEQGVSQTQIDVIVQQTITSPISNTTTVLIGSGTGEPPSSWSSSGTTTSTAEAEDKSSAPVAKTDEVKKDEKKEDKKEEKREETAATISTKNESAKKMYCN